MTLRHWQRDDNCQITSWPDPAFHHSRPAAAFASPSTMPKLPSPGRGEVIVQDRGCPDQSVGYRPVAGAVDLATLHRDGDGERCVLRGKVPTERLAAMQARFGQALPVGNEGAGTVVDAGPGSEHLLGQDSRRFWRRDVCAIPDCCGEQCMPLLPGTTQRKARPLSSIR